MIQNALKEAKQDRVGDSDNTCCPAESWNGLHAAQVQVEVGLLTRACLYAVTSSLAGYQHLSKEGRGASLRTVKWHDFTLCVLWAWSPYLSSQRPPGRFGKQWSWAYGKCYLNSRLSSCSEIHDLKLSSETTVW